MKLNYKCPVRLPTDLKYILKWTEAFSHYNEPMFRNGQFVFLENNCSHTNCFMTNDKTLLTDVRNNDAILFDVENNWDQHPIFRSPNQKFIFMASESASNFPVCHPYFDSYYNWTWSYKLNSDIQRLFVYIYDKKGELVGPKMNMTWIDPMEPTSKEVKTLLKRKRKAIAWFVSSCHSKSRRELVANNLTMALRKYDLKIDIYGWCGKLTCPRDRMGDCLEFLKENYYFYLSFENSLSDDYVTEKIMHAVMHYTVPIVYGGADYSRYLPPHSYLNALELGEKELARSIHNLMRHKEQYFKYFNWRNHYVIKATPMLNGCALCETLNNPAWLVQKGSYSEFRKWWNPEYENRCAFYTRFL
ncbi:alpha-(1,3)-fucosyltransferase C [Manduca sexta]|uniref:alpha-(1,3)-fucosyltransferase C n=1 Tax=Manduca sexta TaxID=7130 RepID=UPI00188E70A7|nr:alpha-(1,3)-fucosyltransferase C [Manduca sexta]